MAGDNRTPDKTIGEIKYAQEQTARTKDKLSREQPAHREEEDVRAKPGLDPAKKKTGEF
jgi:hypothetical protein